MIELQLSRGLVALIDDCDEEHARFKWHAASCSGIFYARRNLPWVGGVAQGLVLLHRAIMGEPKGLDVDHVNGNGLDNRRHNLRVCAHRRNMQNQRRPSGGSSRFKGVSWRAEKGAWRARIKYNDREIFLGHFADETEAARAYDAAAIRYFGEYAATNEAAGLFQENGLHDRDTRIIS